MSDAPLQPPLHLPLTVCPEQPCPYMPGRVEQLRAFAADSFPPQLYHAFMDAGFRRSGRYFYQPVCQQCRACRPIRVLVDHFTPGKSQRRYRRRNADLISFADKPQPSIEKHQLYRRYVSARHQGPMVNDDRESFEQFLYHSPVDTFEITHRDGAGRLLVVGICDVCPQSLSSVYFFFDPDFADRRLGTFGAIYEIELAHEIGIPHYYMGFWIRGCRQMEYKASFRPCEVLCPDGEWRPLKSGYGPEPDPAETKTGDP